MFGFKKKAKKTLTEHKKEYRSTNYAQQSAAAPVYNDDMPIIVPVLIDTSPSYSAPDCSSSYDSSSSSSCDSSSSSSCDSGSCGGGDSG